MAKVKATIADLERDRELYFETCLKIRTKRKKIVPFALKPVQRRLFDVIDLERRNGRCPKIIICKGRQQGFSTAAQAEFFRGAHLQKNYNALVVAHRIESAEYLFEMSKRFYDNLPPALRYDLKYSTKRLIHFKDNDSRLQVEVATEARGYAGNVIHGSEVAFWPDAEKVHTAIMDTVDENPENLIVYESTANGIGGLFHELWAQAVQGMSEWVPIFSPWFHEAEYRRKTDLKWEDLTPEEKKRVEQHGLDLEQIDWYRHHLANRKRFDLDLMRQEHPETAEEAFLFSGRPVFEPTGIQHYQATLPPSVGAEPLPPQVEIEPGGTLHKPNIIVAHRGRLRIYREPQPRHRYLAGVDLSEGDPGSDGTPIVITNQHTLDVDAVWSGRTPPEQLAQHAFRLLHYYNEAKCNPEANMHGGTFIYALQALGYRNFFYRMSNPDGITGKPTDKIGWDTKEQSRAFLFNCCREYVARRIGHLRDPDLIHQLSVIRYDEKTGRPDHPDGENDDIVIAWGLTLVIHKDYPDQPLMPLDLATRAAASELVQEVRRRQSVGHSLDDLDMLGMSCEDLERLDEARARQEKSRRRYKTDAMA